ncbi:hypothetical protein EJB05_21051, partial [Eragrostis curvula]
MPPHAVIRGRVRIGGRDVERQESEALKGAEARPGPSIRKRAVGFRAPRIYCTDSGEGQQNSGHQEQEKSSTTNYKMPEVRGATRPVLADLSGGGFFIRRVASPGAVVVKGGVKPLARRALTPSSNKENVPPAGAMMAAPKRRSPLPDWYPRTPLRDITSIVKALERKRLRDAASRQQIQWTEDTSLSLEPTTENPSSTQDVATPATSSAKDKLTRSSSPSDCSLQTPSRPVDPALSDLLEKELSSSIEQIEKMVRRNLKQTPKAAQPSKRVVQRRILMSMR